MLLPLITPICALAIKLVAPTEWLLLAKWRNIDANVVELACSIYFFISLSSASRRSQYCLTKKNKIFGNKQESKTMVSLKKEMRSLFFHRALPFFSFLVWNQIEYINCSRCWKMYHFLFSTSFRIECYKLLWRFQHSVRIVDFEPLGIDQTNRSETEFQAKWIDTYKKRKRTSHSDKFAKPVKGGMVDVFSQYFC